MEKGKEKGERNGQRKTSETYSTLLSFGQNSAVTLTNGINEGGARGPSFSDTHSAQRQPHHLQFGPLRASGLRPPNAAQIKPLPLS